MFWNLHDMILFDFSKNLQKVSLVDTLLNLGLSYIMKQNIYDVVNNSQNQMESKILNMIFRNILIIDFWDYFWKNLEKNMIIMIRWDTDSYGISMISFSWLKSERYPKSHNKSKI